MASKNSMSDFGVSGLSGSMIGFMERVEMFLVSNFIDKFGEEEIDREMVGKV